MQIFSVENLLRFCLEFLGDLLVKQEGKKLQNFFSISRIMYRIYRVASGFDNGFRVLTSLDLGLCEHTANLLLLFIVSRQQITQNKCN